MRLPRKHRRSQHAAKDASLDDEGYIMIYCMVVLYKPFFKDLCSATQNLSRELLPTMACMCFSASSQHSPPSYRIYYYYAVPAFFFIKSVLEREKLTTKNDDYGSGPCRLAMVMIKLVPELQQREDSYGTGAT